MGPAHSTAQKSTAQQRPGDGSVGAARLDEESIQALLQELLEGGEAGVAQQAVQVLVQDHLLADAGRWVIELHM
jgi:hypothetical protein